MNGETKEGMVPIVGAIGVHPSLSEWPRPEGEIDIPSLFLTGGSDFLTGPQAMAKLETDLLKSTVAWETIRYAKIVHAFSNWFKDGYNARADARSWHSTLTFLDEAFGLDSEWESLPQADVTAINYADGADGDYQLKGYVSMPKNSGDEELLPAVIILPHEMNGSTGPNEFEQQVATQIANNLGYIGFVGDIYSIDLLDTGASELLDDVYHANTTKFISRVRAAVDYVKIMDGVDPDNLAVVGFGFGGAGALYYAMSLDDLDTSVKAIISVDGELDEVANSNLIAANSSSMSNTSESVAWGGGSDGGTWGGTGTGTGTGTDGNNEWAQDETFSSSSWNSTTGSTRRRKISVNDNVPYILIQSV